MRRAWLVLAVACGPDVATPGVDESSGATTAEASSTDATTAIETTSSSSESSTSGGEDASTTDATTTGAGSSTSTGEPVEDPFAVCASARSEAECESLEVDPPGQGAGGECNWRNVHTLAPSEDGCELLMSETRCVLFYGFLQGCGGGPSCGAPNKAEMFTRQLEDTVELLFYPQDELCGPLPGAPPDEPPWTNCAADTYWACECICDLL